MGVNDLLLDTHIFLWWLFDDARLPGRIRSVVKEVENRVFISAASVGEIATKFRLGKLPQATEVAGDVPAWIDRAGFSPMPVMPAHAQLAGVWGIPHRDPFDRMLAAQSKIEQIPLASVDPAMAQFPITVIGR